MSLDASALGSAYVNAGGVGAIECDATPLDTLTPVAAPAADDVEAVASTRGTALSRWRRAARRLYLRWQYGGGVTQAVFLQPGRSVVRAWAAAPRALAAYPGLALTLIALFTAPVLLDLAVRYVGHLSQLRLALAGAVWQAFTAGALGFLAPRLHLFGMGGEWADRKPTKRVALTGAVCAVLVFAALKLAWLGLAIAATTLPQLLRPFGSSFASFVCALLFVPTVFIRPAISLGYERPLANVVAAVRRKPIAVILTVWALALPLIAVQFALLAILLTIEPRPGPGLLLAFHAPEVLFNVVNFVAFEMAAARLLRNLNTYWTWPHAPE